MEKTYLLALLLGFIAGLRAVAAPAAVSWAARVGVLNLQGTRLAFLGETFTPWILTALAVGELITDQLPTTPSRKTPSQFIARILSGAIVGAAVGLSARVSWETCLLIGVAGAIVGTLGGYELRRRLTAAFHRDRPAALIEDAAAVVGLVFIVLALGPGL